ncbi:EAL domain-containing protein [Magnetospirillum sp. UT-4]|uniref:EAL domain-containing protein n=1 Tax=Magnetospirillum sp. UT-4 TaxID=2681467 RepID=UPI00138501BF|nr:EAL domain-containing protein [Magnetospirillum sp. UT-4]CAA7620327.1 EAL domain [Magnetospirillum sp. UT-4]
MTANAPSAQAVFKAERDRFLKLAFCRADLLFELDHAHEIVFCAGPTAPLFGAIEARMAGTRFFDLIAEGERRRTEAAMMNLDKDGRLNDMPVVLRSGKGSPVHAVLAGFRAREFDNHFFLALKIQLAEAEAAAAEACALEEQPDEAAFAKVAAQRLHQAGEAGDEAKVSLIRLRKLKELAEKLGGGQRHSLLAAIGRVLRRYSLGGDAAGRIDDDSFAFAHGAGIDPEKVNAEIEEAAQAFLPAGTSIDARSVTLEADIGSLTEDQVARALAHSMQQFCAGKDRLTVQSLTDALDEMLDGTVKTAKYFQQVTKKGDFDVVYMPICDLRLGKVHHFEALSRFRDAERAKSTFQIITLAENLGVIADFDLAVVAKVTAELDKVWKRKPLPTVAVNLSGISLASDRFVEALHKYLGRVPGLNRRMMFEMTESAGIADMERTNKVIQSLRSKGYLFSLDDFGAGSASFDYLNAFDVDIVKFDGPVVRRACASKRGHDLLSTMSKMCTQAGIQTVAEMVEDKKVANQLFYCGVDYGQGWYFGKPSANPLDFEGNFAGAH